MYPFPEAAAPAVKNHLEAQLSFFNAVSKSLFSTAQQYGDLNIQLAQTLLEEGTHTGQRVLSARPSEAVAAAAAHAQPVAGKLRTYQQHLARLAADTQVDLANVAEQHIGDTSRTARDLAEQVQRVASEETSKVLRAQQDALQNIADPFQSVVQTFSAIRPAI